MDFGSKRGSLGAESSSERMNKNNDADIISVPRNIDYQIAGLIAGGIAGEVAHAGLGMAGITSSEPVMIIIGAVLGYICFKPLMRLLT
jgi:hypothetical protein